MHFVALNEILVLLQIHGGIRNVHPDVVIQVPAEVLIRHREEQSVHLYRTPAGCLQGPWREAGEDIAVLKHCGGQTFLLPTAVCISIGISCYLIPI